MNWSNKRVLLTGAGGFIGSHLTEELVRRGARVRALVRYNSQNSWANLEQLPEEVKGELEIVGGDIRDPFLVDHCTQGTDVVFHLASLIAIPYSYLAPQSYVETNITGTLNVLQAVRKHKVAKLVHTSTSETYGTALYTPIDEKHPLQGQSPYSASKIGADKLVESYHRSFDVPVATIRPFNTYGPRQSARAVIPTIISQAISRDRVELGSLSPIRDLTFVSDTVEGFIRIAETPETIGEVVNIGNGYGATVGEVAERILKLLDAQIPILTSEERVRPERSEVLELICDNSKASALTGWKPCVSLERGLAETIEWVRANRDAYKSDVYNV